MMNSRTFCPRCGSSVPPEDLEESDPSGESALLCTNCYLEKFDLVTAPDSVTVTVCTRCGAINRETKWVDVDTADLTDISIDAIHNSLKIHRDATDVAWRVDPEHIDTNTIKMHCLVTASVKGRSIESEKTIPVSISRQTCPRCGKIAGDYFTGVVQVRSVDRSLRQIEKETVRSLATDIVESMQKTGDRDAFITDISQTEHGLDVKVSTTKIGRNLGQRIISQFGGSMKSAETLVTEDADGNPVYRVTYAVHLPPFVPGDVIEPEENGPVLVTSAHDTVKGIQLLSGDRYVSSFEEGDRPSAIKLGTVEDAERTTLVSIDDEHAVQVLDPETYRSVSITKPPFLDPTAETVKVLKSFRGLFILPEDSP